MVFMVPKNNDARLGVKWAEILIILDSEDTHRGDSPKSPFFPESSIFTQHNFFIRIKVLDAMLFFKEAFKPNLPVGMSVCQCLEKRRWAVPMEVDGIDK
jgi:hypothetical protein